MGRRREERCGAGGRGVPHSMTGQTPPRMRRSTHAAVTPSLGGRLGGRRSGRHRRFREENGAPAILQPRKNDQRGRWPPVQNQEWFAANHDGPIRKIVSELCGVGCTEVGKYIKEHVEGGGVLRSALPRGPVKKARAKWL